MLKSGSLTKRVVASFSAVSLLVLFAAPAAIPASASADCRTVALGHGLVCGPRAWCQDGYGEWHSGGEQVTVVRGGRAYTYECGSDGYWYRVS
jgi:hypothetical protein